MKRLPQNIMAARQAEGLNQQELAVRVGVTKSLVSQWESDTVKSIKGENLLKLADTLRVSPNWLLYGKTPVDEERARCKEIKPSTEAVTTYIDPDLRVVISLFENASELARSMVIHALTSDAASAHSGRLGSRSEKGLKIKNKSNDEEN